MFALLTKELVAQGIDNAVKGHMTKPGVQEFLSEREYYESEIYRLLSQRVVPQTRFDFKEIVSPNGKHRITARSSVFYRSIMHVCILLYRSVYWKHLTPNIFNCIKGRGINAKDNAGNPCSQIRRVIATSGYDYYLQLDYKHCYENTDANKVKRALSLYIKDESFIEIVVRASVCSIGLPVGAPTSPQLHHFVIFAIEYFLVHEIRLPHIIYADDILIFGYKQDLHAAYWRFAQFSWYVLGYELKKIAHPTPIRCGIDILGYVFFPGTTQLRKSTKIRAKRKWNNPLSRASYLGILKGGDCANLRYNLDLKHGYMKEKDFFESDDMLVVRRMNSPVISLQDIGEERSFSIIDYEYREGTPLHNGKKGKPWYRMQVEGVFPVPSNPTDDNSPKEEKHCRRLVKGFDPSICGFFENVEKKMLKVSVLEDKDLSVVRQEVMVMLSNRTYQLEHRKDGWCFAGTVKIEE